MQVTLHTTPASTHPRRAKNHLDAGMKSEVVETPPLYASFTEKSIAAAVQHLWESTTKTVQLLAKSETAMKSNLTEAIV
jgi:hypothetical protein